MVEYLASNTPNYEESFLSNSTNYQTPNDISILSAKRSKHKQGGAKDTSIIDEDLLAPYQSPEMPLSSYVLVTNDEAQLADCTKLAQKPHIGVKEEANPFLVANKHILSGYRINYNTWGATVCSLFEMHNETVNVWTHFIGFLACFYSFLVMSCAQSIDDATQLTDNARQLLYLIQEEAPKFDTGFIES